MAISTGRHSLVAVKSDWDFTFLYEGTSLNLLAYHSPLYSFRQRGRLHVPRACFQDLLSYLDHTREVAQETKCVLHLAAKDFGCRRLSLTKL